MNQRQINKIFVANRGEIALRIISTAQKMGINTVLPVTAHEKESLPAKKADKVFLLKSTDLAKTYLDADLMINLAISYEADAIHPGYGFLSENTVFADKVEKAGLIWIGPSPEAIAKMGNKLRAREIAREAGISVTRALTGKGEEILNNHKTLSFPLLIKAAAGGGGKGMKIARDYQDLEEMLLTAGREAKSYFGDETVFVEEYIENPRHIEVQVFGDQSGNNVHLFERECSIQRRYQKIIEEAPSPFANEQLRSNLTADALKLCRAINYHNAGTVEFLVDSQGKHYFLEMNTRLQVEHPVTEAITGLDLVEQQIKVAMGLPLDFTQDEIIIKGHAIEARVYAEDALTDFSPAPGDINFVKWPDSKKVRTDTFFDTKTEIQPEFDPMLAKITSYAFNRDAAITKLSNALEQTSILGVTTNLPYLSELLKTNAFRNGDTTTHFTAQHHNILKEAINPNGSEKTRLLWAAYLVWLSRYRQQSSRNIWSRLGHQRWSGHCTVKFNNKEYELKRTNESGQNNLFWEAEGMTMPPISDMVFSGNHMSFRLTDIWHYLYWQYLKSGELLLGADGYTYRLIPGFQLPKKVELHNSHENMDKIVAPIPGRITSVLASPGEKVTKGTPLMILEAMKMENTINALSDGILKNICIHNGDQVKAGQVLVEFEN
ncbi:acetyl/propionyl/methylcrotonyl-CoA carboxylase subunit alpha [Marinilabilia rubra]|uniref:Carbamoyl-phosphate synthase subunit L n=1 Tax=Marinilabilia rubra TaxID=2162893 RepID=A0A2U2B591_9BACT|nr:biotin carboxylase N-terminal domain-containing protein [Marinilabilia rubra]PWD98217.1 carbamoyl-phosphate synthase subunit L [Marinilabilia rubra]